MRIGTWTPSPRIGCAPDPVEMATGRANAERHRPNCGRLEVSGEPERDLSSVMTVPVADDEVAMAESGLRGEAESGRPAVCLLGPVSAEIHGRPVVITAARQRAVLAALAIQAGRPVSADQLLEVVWGDDPPRTGVRSVAYQISKLRNIFEPERNGEGTVIATSPAGYSLTVDPDRVDLMRFNRLIDDARAGLRSDPGRSEQLLDDALVLWRGDPFADVGAPPFADAERRRLERRRSLARRTLAEARMAQGRFIEAIADLESLVEEEPLEEALVQLLMTALHHGGRTAEALRAFGELRRRLGEELGIEPSGDLRRFETELLTGTAARSQDSRLQESRAPASGAGARDPAPRPSAIGRPTPVPSSPSSFVGRTAELAEIQSLLTSTRLVTLSGFGGLGKTRLAQQIATAAGARHADGVWFVDLTAIADGALLVDTLIAAGGGGVSSEREPIDLLLALLEPLDLLLVIDNCEHLVDDVAALIGPIMSAAPAVRVLATSRRSLGVIGEAVRPVPPLDPEAAEELFIDRAFLARSNFTVDGSNRSAIDELCARLEGIPLAIEMAAARLSVLTVDQIVDHLDDRFQLLTRAERAADHKQRSLAAVMDWSFELLEPDDRRLLGRISVCADGFDLEAASALRPSSMAPTEVVDRLAHLVEASLVSFSDRGDTPRYRMLETVREHATARLDESERYDASLAHAEHFELVATRLSALTTEDLPAQLAVGDRELGNFRAAMTWCYANNRPLTGLSIINQVRSYMWSKMMNREILRWLTAGIDLVADDGHEVLRACAVAVVEAFNVGDHRTGQAAVKRVMAGIDGVEDDELRALLLSALGTHMIETAPRAADHYYLQAATLPSLPPLRVLSILNNRVEVSWISGSLVDGDAILDMLSDVAPTVPAAEGMVVKIEAGVAARAERWEDVIRLAEAASGLDPANEAAVQITCAEALGAVGRFNEALAVLDGLDLVAHGHYERNADLVRAAVMLGQGDAVAALVHLDDLVSMVGRNERRIAIAVPVAALLVVIACELDQHEAAATTFGFVEAERTRLGIGLRPTDQRLVDVAVDRCRSVLGSEGFARLADEGAALTWNELPVLSLPRPLSDSPLRSLPG